MLSGAVDESRVARRHRTSPYPLISVEEAINSVLKHSDIQPAQTVHFKGKRLTNY